MLKCLIVGSNGKSVAEIKDALQAYKLRTDCDILIADASLHLINPKKYDLIFVGDDTVTKKEINTKLRAMMYLGANNHGKRISYKKNQEWNYFDTATILGIEVIGRNCHVHTIRGVHVLNRQSLTGVLERIGDPYLVRCHKSYAVNLRYVIATTRIRRGLWKMEFFLDNDFDCLLGHAYYEQIQQKLR